MTGHNNEKQLSHTQLEEFQRNFDANPLHKLAMNAVTRNNLQEIALNRNVLNDMNFCFTHEVETAEVTDQAKANTCWLFADLNWLRTLTQKKINVKKFEFSENYLMFFDKLEKSNFFLENMIALRDKNRDDRLVAFLLNEPNPDGGEWHMTANLIEKYGLIPKEVMPDTFNRGNSGFVNEIVSLKLRQGASIIRKLHQNGKSETELRTVKKSIMNDIYRILIIFFGVPPKKFSWSYRDEKKKYHQEIDITPQQFYERYVELNLDDMYNLLSCPAQETPFEKTFTLDYFNNMSDARRLHYLNVPLETLKKIAVEVLKNGEACLFGCEVRYQCHSKEGILDNDLYDYDLIFNTDFSLTKAERVEFLHVRLTHAMVLTGVEIVAGKPVRWKIENSWGDKLGKKGYFIMTDRWFDEYTFDIVVHKKYLSQDILEGFQQEPIALPPWHPMG
ncbi:C1 family peptidase [candidate division CSSED10-310 bacterium]|uniref:Aminopeptidase n=1 Tax=candidate division CSSED10-310 bacterium TaxID=2855610 RepID=A0ABV6Z6W9_UNCC1